MAWKQEGWRRAKQRWVQRQEARWWSKGGVWQQGRGQVCSRWRLVKRQQGQGGQRRRCEAARSKTSGPTATASRAAAGANRRSTGRGLCGEGWGASWGQRRQRLGGGGKRGWVT